MLHENEEKIKREFLEEEGKEISEYEEPINYVYVCPYCGSREVVRNGTYVRNIVFLKDGRISVRKIRMQRFLCKKCKRTGTHYPAFLVPRKEYSMGLLIATAIVGRKKLIEIGIPEGQVREIRRKNKRTKNKLKHILSNKSFQKLSEVTKEYTEKFLEKPFYPYQRDVYITGLRKAMYTPS